MMGDHNPRQSLKQIRMRTIRKLLNGGQHLIHPRLPIPNPSHNLPQPSPQLPLHDIILALKSGKDPCDCAPAVLLLEEWQQL
jgi:hypothetical protein